MQVAEHVVRGVAYHPRYSLCAGVCSLNGQGTADERPLTMLWAVRELHAIGDRLHLHILTVMIYN